tara:strand:+ start:509 stop:913 length:405 start_codon:yes stop_codon:yes gene_type:complete
MAKESANMFDTFRDENSIKAIATSLPKRLVNKFDKKEFYSSEEVDGIFSEVFENNVNIQYAYAMFCSPKDYINLAQTLEFSSSYSELRLKVADKCFDGWPRFNFESLLNLTSDSSRSDLVNEITDIGFDLLSGS